MSASANRQASPPRNLTRAEIGACAGTYKGLCGMAGTLVGGLVVAQISRGDNRWKLWVPAIMSGLAGPVFAVCMLRQDFATMGRWRGPRSWSASISARPLRSRRR